MRYKGRFDYYVLEGSKDKSQRTHIPVGFFQVKGGADRFVKTSSQDDVNIAAELEEATTFKNIILYLPPAKDGSDMQVALELTDVALNNKLNLLVFFAVEKYSGGRMIETFVLSGKNATLTKRPYIVGTGQVLKVELRFSEALWYRGKLNNKNQMLMEEM